MKAYCGQVERFMHYRKTLRIRQGKGKKDRYTLLSEVALDVLRQYYQKFRPRHWMFEGQDPRKHLTERSVQKVFEKALVTAKIMKNVSVHSLRHSFATHVLEGGYRSSLHSRTARSQKQSNDGALYTC